MVIDHKVDVPNLMPLLKRTPIFEGLMVGCRCKNGHQKDVLKRDWMTCSKLINHSRRNSEHNWGSLYDHWITRRIFTLAMHRIYIRALHLRGKWLQARFGFANHPMLIACFLQQRKEITKFAGHF